MRSFGYALTLEPRIELGDAGIGRVHLGLRAELQVLSASDGVIKQRFYRDNPDTPQDERTIKIIDGDFKFTSVRRRLMAFAELRF